MTAQAATRPCILIPTYDNGGTVADVARRAAATGLDVIIVDDGSTDTTPAALATVAGITVHRYEQNRGKGAALLTGFDLAAERGFTHAIALDSDGQHYPEDVPLLLKAIDDDPAALIVGARDLVGAGAGRGSRFGCRFSNFWVYALTGQRVPDSQSGYRAYPIEAMRKLALRTRGFSFEVEVLVRASWIGVRLKSVPIQVRYFEADERVSHFRPLRDFGRIGLLNTHLCTLRICLPAPYLALTSQRQYHDLPFLERVRQSARSLVLEGHGSPLRVASSVSLGLFIGLTPFWGLQVAMTLGLAHVLRLSKTVAVLAAHVSFPLMIPPITYAALVLGRGIVGAEEVTSLEFARADVPHLLIGHAALATLSAVVGFGLTLAVMLVSQRWKART